MPLLSLLDLGQPPLAVLVGRSVYQLDDTDDRHHGFFSTSPQRSLITASSIFGAMSGQFLLGYLADRLYASEL